MNFKSLFDFFRPWKRGTRQDDLYRDPGNLSTIVIRPEDISPIIFDEKIFFEPDDEIVIGEGLYIEPDDVLVIDEKELEKISEDIPTSRITLPEIVKDEHERSPELIRCPYCQEPLQNGLPLMECSTCKTSHHLECWQANDGCTTYGCDNSSSE